MDRVFLTRNFPVRVYELVNRVWLEMPTSGLNPLATIALPYALDDGSGPALYVVTSGGPEPRRGFRWSDATQSWTAMPDAFTDGNFWPINSCDFGNGTRIYGQKQFGGLYRWDGADWTHLANTVPAINAWMADIVRFDSGATQDVYLMGHFLSIDGVVANGLAKWNGTEWSQPVPDVYFEPGLTENRIRIGDLGDGPAMYMQKVKIPTLPGKILKFNGITWSQFGTYDLGGGLTALHTMNFFDDGRGTALFIGGQFGNFEGIAANGLVRYDGETYEAVGAGCRHNHMMIVDDMDGKALFLGDVLSGGGGGTITNRVALYVGCPNCYANCDLSTTPPVLNVADFSCFLQKYAKKDPYANCTVDAAINVADFQCFLSRFAAGCP